MPNLELNVLKEKNDIDSIFEIARRYEDEKDELSAKIDELEELIDETGKKWYHRAGDALDRLRIVPRALMALFGYLFFKVVEAGIAESDFDGSALVAAVGVPFAYICMGYFQTGEIKPKK